MTDQENAESETRGERFEQSMVNELAREFLREQRRSRRWSIFFKLLLAIYVFAFFAIYIAGNSNLHTDGFPGEKHTALVDIDGVISANTEANADSIVAALRAAFEDHDTKGVILRINSPGGSPVQAGYVNDEIRRLRAKYPKIHLYAVIGDMCASGGYYIASAADKIYADKASIVGSIGVIMEGFGFVDAIKKLGIERRVLHAGEHKDFMDPFAPEDPDEVAQVRMLLDNIYQQFIDVVKKGRGKRLKDDPKIFSGLVWTGQEAVKLGLVDGLGSPGYVARDVIGAEHIVDYTRHENYFDRFAKRLGVAMADRLQSMNRVQLY